MYNDIYNFSVLLDCILYLNIKPNEDIIGIIFLCIFNNIFNKILNDNISNNNSDMNILWSHINILNTYINKYNITDSLFLFLKVLKEQHYNSHYNSNNIHSIFNDFMEYFQFNSEFIVNNMYYFEYILNNFTQNNTSNKGIITRISNVIINCLIKIYHENSQKNIELKYKIKSLIYYCEICDIQLNIQTKKKPQQHSESSLQIIPSKSSSKMILDDKLPWNLDNTIHDDISLNDDYKKQFEFIKLLQNL